MACTLPAPAPAPAPASVPTDNRHIAGALNTVREAIIHKILNAEETDNDEIKKSFPCSIDTLRSLRTGMLTVIPTATGTTRAGTMSAHHDEVIQTATSPINTEIKVTQKNGSKKEILEWQPWKDTVQFLQAQLKSKLAQRFLGPCGTPMLQAFFETVVTPFIREKVPAAIAITYGGYEKALFTIGMKGTQEETAFLFINTLRQNKSLQKALQKKWIEFETSWLTSHTPDHAAFENTLRDVIESKDWWICVSKKAAHWIEGFNVERLTYTGTSSKKQGGTVYTYTLTLQKKGGGELHDVPIVLKFHWKNGGQAVQNLNIMVL